MTEDTSDRIDLLVQAQNHHLWCWDCGMTKEDCDATDWLVKCCPDCRHPRVEKNIEDVQLAAVGYYLCETTNHCTCGAGGMGYGHEPHCGLEPVYPLGMVQRALRSAAGLDPVRAESAEIPQIVFLSLDRPCTSYNQEPLIIAADAIEAITAYEYSDGGFSRRDGSAVRTRSGETFVVAKTPTEVRELIDKAQGGNDE